LKQKIIKKTNQLISSINAKKSSELALVTLLNYTHNLVTN